MTQYYCHQCKENIPHLRLVDSSCPRCLSDFVEERDTVEKEEPLPLAKPKADLTIQAQSLAEKTFYCYSCQKIIPNIRLDMTCNVCHSGFILELTEEQKRQQLMT